MLKSGKCSQDEKLTYVYSYIFSRGVYGDRNIWYNDYELYNCFYF